MADLDTIAAVAGVSRRTVARVLSDQAPEPIRPFAIKRAKRIRQIAEEVGYRSNAAARAVSTGRFNSLSFVLEGQQDTWFSPIMMLGLHDRCADLGMNLVFTRVSRAEIEKEATMPRVLREAACDGLLMHWLRQLPAGVEKLLHRHRLPYVFLNDRKECNCIYFADEAAACEATRRLIELGHRKIAHVTSIGKAFGHYSQEDRRRGYESAMHEAGLADASTVHAVNGMYSKTDRPDIIGQLCGWLGSEDRPTAVLTHNADLAAAVMAAAMSVGLRVPHDLSVICFTAIDISPIGLIHTSMKLPDYDLGQRAVELAMKRIEAPDRDLEPMAMALDFFEGQTVAPCP